MEKREVQALDGFSDESVHSKMEENSTVEPKTNSSTSIPLDANTETGAEDAYLTGLKLIAVLSAVSMAAFLMLMDNSVVVTVSERANLFEEGGANCSWAGNS